MVHMAHNGKEALSLWEKEPVDLVVTDVEMPVMNGLNLLKEIRSRDERVRFVILTGYDEFEYARKAIQLDVEDYILKPIDEVQLETVVKNALIKLQEMDRDKAKNMEDRIGWQKFLEGGISEEERKTFLALLPKVKKSELLSAAVMKIDSRSMRKGDMSELLSILQEEECRVIHLKADTLLLIEGFQTDYTWDGGEGETARKARAEIHSRFSYLQNRLESELGIFTFISIGPSFRDHSSLPEAYREAMRMQKYRMLDGYGSCVDDNHIKNRGSKDVAIDEAQLRKMILQKDRDGAIDYIEDLFINNIRKDADVNNLYQTALKIAMLLWDIKGEYKLEEKNMQDLSDMVEGIYGAEDIFGL